MTEYLFKSKVKSTPMYLTFPNHTNREQNNV